MSHGELAMGITHNLHTNPAFEQAYVEACHLAVIDKNFDMARKKLAPFLTGNGFRHNVESSYELYFNAATLYLACEQGWENCAKGRETINNWRKKGRKFILKQMADRACLNPYILQPRSQHYWCLSRITSLSSARPARG